MKNNISQLLTHRAYSFSQVEAVIDANNRFTYEQLNNQVNQLVHWFQEQNIKPGERIALLCNNSSTMLSILLAVAKHGSIAVPLNCRLNPEEFVYILNHSEPKVLFYDESIKDALSKIRNTSSLEKLVQIGELETSDFQFHEIIANQPTTEPEIVSGGDDPYILGYTSGTTGKPKGTIISHHNLWMGAYAVGNHLDWRTFDRNLIITPMFHISGSMFTTVSLLRGVTVIYADFHPSKIWEIIEVEKVTQLFGVPTMIKLMMSDSSWFDKEIDTFRYIICGADTVPAQLIQKCNSYGIEICHMYGCTEFSGAATCWSKGMDPDKKHTVGRAVPFTDIKVVNPMDGKEVPRGTIGEVLYKGPQLFQGYWNNQEETNNVLRRGWYHSGDLGKLDEDGYLVIVDRYKDMIIYGGSNIYPAEIEGILLNLVGIQEVAVVGAPDELQGQIPVAFVVKRPNSKLTKNDILEFCRGRLAAFKCGKNVEFIEALPRNTNGKVLKNELRALAKQILERSKEDKES